MELNRCIHPVWFVPLSILTISILEGSPLVSPTIMQLVFRYHHTGCTILKLSSSCISEIIMVLLRIISGIPLFMSLIVFLCAYCISPGYPSDGPVDHYPTYEPLAGLGPLPRFLQPLWVIGISPVLRGLCGTMVLCPCYSTGFWYLRTFSPWYFTGYDRNWDIRPFHGANLIFETSGDAFKR